MEFRVLGPIDVRDNGRVVDLGGPQQRLVLALLLGRANTVVSVDRLVDSIWGDQPPPTARKTIQVHISSLRQSLGSNGELETRAPGYVLHVAEHDLDAVRFGVLVREAGAVTDSDPDQASAVFEEALALWQGAPYEDLSDTDALRPEIVRLEQLHLSAQEGWVKAELMAGRHEGVLPELEPLIAEHPFREQLRALHMLALYRSGRQSDALSVYTDTRRILAEELGLEPTPSLQRLEARILAQDPVLDTRSALHGEPTPSVPVEVRNPYKGLRPFGEVDSEDFFGRDDLIRQLVERLERRDSSGRLIALLGASGSGKSSVVAAGLIPLVREGGVAGSGDWIIVAMYPGTDPFGNLAKELSRSGESPTDIRDHLVSDGIAGVLKDSAGNSLLVIDQFEEIFTQVADEEAVARFLDQLVDAVLDDEAGVHIVVTIRADYLDKPLAHRRFSELLGNSMVLVPALTDHEARQAVVGPATRVGIEVEPELVAVLAGDVGSHASALPLMQFALTDVFGRRSGNVLTLDAYQSIGGLFGALARRADGMYAQFTDPEKEACRQVMLRMVTLGVEGDVVRRRVPRADLTRHDPDVSTRVIDELGRNRLITFDRDQTGEATVEIAHESLTREWPLLRGWIEASQTDIATRARIRVGAQEWSESDYDDAFLLSGNRLAAATVWLDETDLEPGESEVTFISESAAREHRLVVARTRRRRVIGGVLAAAALVSVLFGVVALAQRNNAQEQARLAVAGRLAASALTTIDDDPQLSILLALEAAETTAQDGPATRAAVESLHQAVLASRVVWLVDLGSSGESVGARFSPDGSRIAAGSIDGAVRIFDASTGATLATIGGADGHAAACAAEGLEECYVQDVRWTPDGNILSIGVLDDPTVRLWDGATGALLETWTEVDGNNLDVSPDGSLIAASSLFNAEVVVWETATGETRMRAKMDVPVGVAFDPVDGSRVAVADLAGWVVLFDAVTGEETLKVPVDQACDVAWSPDGTLMAVAGDPSAVRVVDTTTGEQVAMFAGHHSATCSVAFSADGTVVLTGGDDGVARVWQTATGAELVPLLGHTERVGFVNLNPDGTRALSTSPDGTLRVWDIRPVEGRRESVAVADSVQTTAAVYDDTNLFLTASGDGMVRSWSRADGTLRRTMQLSVSDMTATALSAGADIVAMGGSDGTIVLASNATGNEPTRLTAWAFVDGLAVSDDGELLAYTANSDDRVFAGGGGEPSVHLVDLSTGEEIRLEDVNVQTSELPPFGDLNEFVSLIVALSPDGSLLAAASRDVIRLWDTATGSDLMTIKAGGSSIWSQITSIAFGESGAEIIATSADGGVAIFDAESGELLGTYDGHVGGVPIGELSPDGTVLATAGKDATIRLWDVASGQEILLIADSPAVVSVDFSEDGSQLLVAGEFGARVYEVHTEHLIDLARSRLVRWWTPEECARYLGTPDCPAAPPG